MQELVYTSAPKGLRLGSRGFCTVASTPGMATPLAERLEALSGYKHLYPPGSENAPLNPVNYSFVTFKLGGKTHYILSRIADAGLDYTQRSNKLAHHVVLEGTELPPGGPAWLMSQPGFFVTKWDDEPRVLGPRQLPSGGPPPLKACSAWHSVTGDAGWAGVLADSLDGNDSTQANVVFPVGTELLTLVQESQSLLGLQKRWGATFSTYYSKLPPGTDCRWRFIPAGTPESVVALRSHGTLMIDISARHSLPKQSALVKAARSGRHETPIVVPTISATSIPSMEPDSAPAPQIQLPTLNAPPALEQVPHLQPPLLPRRKSLALNLPEGKESVGARWQPLALVALVAFACGLVITTGVFAWRQYDATRKSPHNHGVAGPVHQDPDLSDQERDTSQSPQDSAENQAPANAPQADVPPGESSDAPGLTGNAVNGSATPGDPLSQPEDTQGSQPRDQGSTDNADDEGKADAPADQQQLPPIDMLVNVKKSASIDRPFGVGINTGPFTIASFGQDAPINLLSVQIVGGDSFTDVERLPSNGGTLPEWQILHDRKKLATLRFTLSNTTSAILELHWDNNARALRQGVETLLASALKISAENLEEPRLCVLQAKGDATVDEGPFALPKLTSKLKVANDKIAKVPDYQPITVSCQIRAFGDTHAGTLSEVGAVSNADNIASTEFTVGKGIHARLFLRRSAGASTGIRSFGIQLFASVDPGEELLTVKQARIALVDKIWPLLPDTSFGEPYKPLTTPQSRLTNWKTHRESITGAWRADAQREDEKLGTTASTTQVNDNIARLDRLVESLIEVEEFAIPSKSDVEFRLQVERQIWSPTSDNKALNVILVQMGERDTEVSR
jgi:hypothetical protein